VTVGAGPMLECVPNFSEGRDSGKIRQIILALRQPGMMLLDYSADRDHNRMVVTVAGPPEAVVEGAVCAVGVAAKLIDLREHRGVHPRMGAADVVPFVPIYGITLERAAELARHAGGKMYRRFGVPVFFYESAAEREEMRRLENVRRGQFEGTAALGKLPDLGGELHASAGAAIVGARNFLVAYNLLLETTDVSIAKQIARQVRESGGGFKSVKALGVRVRGQAQVTVNVTNFHEAPVELVFERVKELAAEFGTKIREGELIGLVPEAALAAGINWTRVIPGYRPETKVLERRLERPMAWPD